MIVVETEKWIAAPEKSDSSIFSSGIEAIKNLVGDIPEDFSKKLGKKRFTLGTKTKSVGKDTGRFRPDAITTLELCDIGGEETFFKSRDKSLGNELPITL